jgi:hypothetical protein
MSLPILFFLPTKQASHHQLGNFESPLTTSVLLQVASMTFDSFDLVDKQCILYTVYIQTLSNVFIHSVEVECEI